MVFYSNNTELKIINNEIASQKLKTKKFPAIVYIVPVIIVGIVVYAGVVSLIGKDNSEVVNDIIQENINEPEEEKDPLDGLNPIQKELYTFNIAKQIISPGEQVSGFIAFRSKSIINELNIVVRDVDYQIVQNN